MVILVIPGYSRIRILTVPFLEIRSLNQSMDQGISGD